MQKEKRRSVRDPHPAGPASQTLPRHWQAPEFQLIERTGRTVTLQELRGIVWVADFFYTSCPGPCPAMTSRLSSLDQRTRAFDDVRLLSISIDPIKDTPEVLQTYARKFGASERWLFLTGDKQRIFDLANRGFKLAVTDQGGTPAEPITHSTKLVLVDKNGTVRGFYEGTSEEESKRIIGDIEKLRRESR